MKNSRSRFAVLAAVLLLTGALLLGGCVNQVSTDSPATLPGGSPAPTGGAKVVYNYGDTGPVKLSDNNIVLKVGEKLVLQPAAGLTKNTRFSSSGEYFFADVMKQENQPSDGKLVFSAVKPGKGRLQIIPNSTETDRAVDLWVTVE